MNIVEHDWPWPHPLDQRDSTDYLVVHHTCGSQNQDTHEIWDEHIAIGDNGIAYHYVIKGDGTVVRGRPRDTIGAHAHGVNQISIGIVLEGNFQPGQDNYVTPSGAQISSLKELLSGLKGIYPDAKIIGHREVAGISGNPEDATDCPGDSLQNMLPDIIANL
jgi:N-acetylmuramoyl-L-alanine amidase